MAVSAVGLFLVGYQWGNQYQRETKGPPSLSGVVIRPAQPLPEFQLFDSDGRPFNREALREHWTLLVVASPASAQGHRSIHRQIAIYNQLGDRPELRRELQLVSLSRDLSPRLAAEFQRLSPAIRLLQGTADEVEALRDALGASDQPAPDQLPPLFLIDPLARLAALFPASLSSEAVAEDLRALADWPEARMEAEPTLEPQPPAVSSSFAVSDPLIVAVHSPRSTNAVPHWAEITIDK